MSAPDIELIAETELISEGYKNAKKLAGKIVSLFRLMKPLLSNQKHYDKSYLAKSSDELWWKVKIHSI